MMRVVSGLLLLVVTQAALAFSHTIEIPEAELQQKVSAMMPLERKMYFITVTLTEPEVKLLGQTNRIGIASRIEASIPGGIKGSGRVALNGTLSYQSKSGEFYYTDPVITDLQVDGLPKKYLPQVRSITQVLLENALAVHPVYTLSDTNLKQALAKAVLKSITVTDGKLVVVLGIF